MQADNTIDTRAAFGKRIDGAAEDVAIGEAEAGDARARAIARILLDLDQRHMAVRSSVRNEQSKMALTGSNSTTRSRQAE